MAADLTTTIVALVSVTIGGVLTGGGSVLAERLKFKREREAVESSARRAFRTETLEQTSLALQALANAVYHQRIERAVYEATRLVSKDDVSAVKVSVDNVYEAQSEASRWSERIHDVGIRLVSLEAVAALTTVHRGCERQGARPRLVGASRSSSLRCPTRDWRRAPQHLLVRAVNAKRPPAGREPWQEAVTQSTIWIGRPGTYR
jgi:hypothetical protein